MLCVGTSVICYSFNIRASKFEIRNYPGEPIPRGLALVILVPMLCIGTDIAIVSDLRLTP